MKHIGLSFAICALLCSGNVWAQEKQIEKASEGNNEFCFDLLNTIWEEGENVAFSPFSISTAMAMTYDGAAWRTKWDIAKTMRFQWSRKKNHEAWTSMLNTFRQMKTPLFKWANAVWAQKDYGFDKEYLNGLQDFDARIDYVDFKNTTEREKGRKAMNQWVESKTENKIQHLIRKTNIDHLTRMVLINAIYFNADWKYQFDPEKTRKNPFKTRTGKVETDFMTMKAELPYADMDYCSAVELPYASDQVSMLVMLPAEGYSMSDMLIRLHEDGFKSEGFEEKKMMIGLPKFKLKTRYEMKNTLISMGMVAPFSTYANFSGMNGK
ncbi:MAG TPA: serpin family protein, partial [Bacteroidales bacterium]|nr:serpin family protein [Bacteroidales bacterium]